MKKKTIIIIILDILALTGFFIFYGPINKIKVWWINTAMNTMSHQYFAYIFYSEDMVKDVLNSNYFIPITEKINLDDIVIDTKPKDSYQNEYDEEILTRGDNDDYKIIEVEIGGYKSYITAIYDPSKVKLISKEVLGTGGNAETTLSMCKRTNSRVCINAGALKPNAQDLSTDIPMGYVIQDGEIIYATNRNAKGNLIGFNKDNKLMLVTTTGSEALEMGMRDAIEFGPFLIINGKAMKSVGNGGYGNAPRSVIAQRKDGVVLFLTTDSKRLYGGPTLDEVIKTLQKYGAYNAANLDGGASTSLVVEGKLHNTPRSGYGKILPQGRGVVTAFALTK